MDTIMPSLNLRLPDDLHQFAKAAARSDGRSLNNWILKLIWEGCFRVALREPAGRLAQDLDEWKHHNPS
jgi:hypothetical protein